jgi:hypothetical protein
MLAACLQQQVGQLHSNQQALRHQQQQQQQKPQLKDQLQCLPLGRLLVCCHPGHHQEHPKEQQQQQLMLGVRHLLCRFPGHQQGYSCRIRQQQQQIKMMQQPVLRCLLPLQLALQPQPRWVAQQQQQQQQQMRQIVLH